MCPDLRRAGYFPSTQQKDTLSPLNDRYTQGLTSKAGIEAESFQVALAVACL